MGGNRAAYASPPSRRRDGEGGGVHSIRRGQLTRLQDDNQQEGESGGEDGDEDHDTKRGVYSTRVNGRGRVQQSEAFGDNEDDDDEDDDDEAEADERERELLREREEMRQRFTFREHKRRNLRSDIVSAMRRKRRMLMRNENLRFRELYKAPEPGVVITVIAMVTVVTLILTKSWPFY